MNERYWEEFALLFFGQRVNPFLKAEVYGG